MKKVIVLLSMIFLLTGCQAVMIDEQSVDTIIDTVLNTQNKLYNNVFD